MDRRSSARLWFLAALVTLAATASRPAAASSSSGTRNEAALDDPNLGSCSEHRVARQILPGVAEFDDNRGAVDRTPASSGSAVRADADAVLSSWLPDFRVTTAAGWGPVQGFVQIPSGGAAGTTSPRRPRLDELDLGDEARFDLGASTTWGDHRLFVRSALLDFESSNRLGAALTHHAESFQSGTAVRAALRLNHHRVGYSLDLPLLQSPEHSLVLAPSVGFGLLDFEMRLDEQAAGGIRSSRSFAKGFATAGLEISHSWRQWLTTDARIDGFPPIDGMPFVLSGTLTTRLHLFDGGLLGDLSGSVLAGVGYERIEFQDSQPTPNHIDVEMGPIVIGGLELAL